jgi:hypothetical protein
MFFFIGAKRTLRKSLLGFEFEKQESQEVL